MKTIFQSHSVLYDRITCMANVLRSLDKLTDEQKTALASLDAQAEEHLRKVSILPRDRFLMVV